MTQPEQEKTAEQILFDIRSENKLEISNILKKYELTYSELEISLKKIESWGYGITKDDDSLMFQSAPDALIDSEISYGLPTKTIGKNIIAFQAVPSTNDSALKLAEQNAIEGTIVVAEKQTNGKGRFGRHWHSVEKKGIYCSIILRPSFSTEFAPGLSLMTAVALADTFSEYTQAKVQIKWPNDILLNRKKTAGILTELSTEKNKINHIIVGVGININHIVDDFPDELSSIATSLYIESKTKVNRVKFLQRFLFHFENAYENYKTDRLKSMHAKTQTYSSLIDTEIQLLYGKKLISGKVVDINKDGALLLESDGVIHVINSGEVTIVKK